MAKFMTTTASQLENLKIEVKKSSEQKTGPVRSQGGGRRKSEATEDDDVVEVTNSYANIALSGIHPLGRPAIIPQPQQKTPGGKAQSSLLSNLLRAGVDKEKEKQKQRGKNVFHGNSRGGGGGGETILAADVALVASGIGVNVKDDELETFLKSNGVDVVKVECLTKKELLDEEKVRSKTMKVIVRAKDHEKAMNPDIWPFRVGVRYYRAESRRPGLGAARQSIPGAESGGLTSRPEMPAGASIQQAGMTGPSNFPRRSQGRQYPPGSKEWVTVRNHGGRQDAGGVVLRNLFKILENQELLEGLGFSNSP